MSPAAAIQPPRFQDGSYASRELRDAIIALPLRQLCLLNHFRFSSSIRLEVVESCAPTHGGQRVES
jgi:hypothetical protein